MDAESRRGDRLSRRPAIGAVLIRGIQLERNRLGHSGEAMRIPKILEEGGTNYCAHVAAAGVVAELALLETGVDGALASIRTMLRFARRNALPMLVRHLAALRVSTLATAGRIDEAERTWQTDELPEDLEGCLDLRGQSWREMEAMSSARLRLLVALEEFDAARDFAHAFARVAMERGLRRTWMRTLAMSMALEYRAGDSAAARAHLVEFPRLFAETDCVMPLVREREISLAVLNSVAEADPDPALATAVEALLPALTDAVAGKSSVPTLTSREADILRRIETQRDKKIASDLGLSLDGVRYHVRKLFLELGARSRLDAVHRARAMGIGLSDLQDFHRCIGSVSP